MTEASQPVWLLQTVFDRIVAYPGESLFANAVVKNATKFPIFVGNCHWKFSCYPQSQPGVKPLNTSIPPDCFVSVPAWQLPIPDVQESQYEARISIDTWIWNPQSANWVNLGLINPDRGEPFYIIHARRFRAFISRSNHDVDRPIVDAIVSQIQRWGFDTHTVGINEIERCEGRVPDRIVEEIAKADCVFAIATPRDVSSMPNLFRTLSWLQNEVAFSFMAKKPTLLIADKAVQLDGLIGTDKIPTIRYSASDLASFLVHLNQLMPTIRDVLTTETCRKWEQQRIQEIEEIRYQSFVAGMVVQKRLQLEQ
ncbi:MAG: hypothetical protein NT105_02175 [Verrucomicrobia bacterium]|nr:hypothetical protein [Verrucomicrobiota bacterium]